MTSRVARSGSLALVILVLQVAIAEAFPPTFTRMSPTNGPPGIEVVITGTGFTGATAVTFNGQGAAFTVTSPTLIKATAPAGVTSGPISISTPEGTATGTLHFGVTSTCTQAISPAGLDLPATGGFGELEVIADSGCSWTVGWNGQWLGSGTAGGTGSGTVAYMAAANTGGQREGMLWIGGRPVVVRQIGWLNDVGAGLVSVQDGSAAWGDYDSDGDLDVLITGWNSDLQTIAKLYRNDGGNVFTDTTAPLLNVHLGSAAWGDYDKDGDLDILLTGYNPGLGPSTRLYRNDDGTFTELATGFIGVSSGSVAWGDYDKDGDLDILLTGWAGIDAASVYRNDGGGAFTDVVAGLVGTSIGSGSWGDYDSDGDLDILLTGRTNTGPGAYPVARVYRNDNGAFVDIGARLIGIEFGSAEWGDYDSDGDLDILLAGSDGSNQRILTLYRNDGGGVFGIGPGVTPGLGRAGWVDYDGDGRLDIAVNSVPEARLYHNDGNGNFVDTGFLPGSQGSLTWGDYDGDGDLDVLVTGWNGRGRSAELYQSTPPMPVPGAFFSLTPCRVIDTRDGSGPLGGPPLSPSYPRVFPLFGRCGIPLTARAVSVNLTVTQPAAAGDLRLYPQGVPPPSASAINYSAGQTRANNAVVALSRLGELTVLSSQASGVVQFILDVNGYFE